MSINPLANRPRADACGFGNGLRRLSTRDLPYNALSTARRQPGILMHVHPVLRWNLKLQQPQLPRSDPDGQPTESSQLGRRPTQNWSTFTSSVNWQLRHRDQGITKLPSVWSVAPREVARSKTMSSALQPSSGAQNLHQQGLNRKGLPTLPFALQP